jgi:hypothetical protein
MAIDFCKHERTSKRKATHTNERNERSSQGGCSRKKSTKRNKKTPASKLQPLSKFEFSANIMKTSRQKNVKNGKRTHSSTSVD